MKQLIHALAIAGLTVCLSATAFAQDTTTSDGGLGGSTSTSTTTTTGVLITVGPILTTTMVASGGSSEQMEQYMRQNATALQQDITAGGGDTLADLSQIFQVDASQRQAFGQLVRAHRAQLVALTDVDSLNQARARVFIDTILGAMKQDARFSDAVARIQG